MMAIIPNSQQQQRKLKMESPMWSGGSLRLYEYCTTAHGWVTTLCQLSCGDGGVDGVGGGGGWEKKYTKQKSW